MDYEKKIVYITNTFCLQDKQKYIKNIWQSKKKSYNFISKAKTLAYLKNKIKHAKILDLIIINAIDYKKNPKKLFIEIEKKNGLILN